MKAERRQELRTNDLAQQIDHAGDYMKQNAATLATIVIVATAVVAAGFWYMQNQKNTRMDAWAKISQRASIIDTAAEPVDKYKAVAEENLDPALTIQAYLKTAQAAYTELGKAKAAGKEPAKNFAQIAEDAYTKVLGMATAPLTIGQATIGLGLLAEDKGDFAKAKEYYKKVIDDTRFADSAIKTQAEFRYNNMDRWASAVVFAAPPPPASQPVVADPSGMTPAGLVTPQAVAPDQVPESVRNLAKQAAQSPTTQLAGN